MGSLFARFMTFIITVTIIVVIIINVPTDVSPHIQISVIPPFSGIADTDILVVYTHSRARAKPEITHVIAQVRCEQYSWR